MTNCTAPRGGMLNRRGANGRWACISSARHRQQAELTPASQNWVLCWESRKRLGPVEKVHFGLARVRLDFSCENGILSVLSFHPLHFCWRSWSCKECMQRKTAETLNGPVTREVAPQRPLYSHSPFWPSPTGNPRQTPRSNPASQLEPTRASRIFADTETSVSACVFSLFDAAALPAPLCRRCRPAPGRRARALRKT
jgi:hypothetical protein